MLLGSCTLPLPSSIAWMADSLASTAVPLLFDKDSSFIPAVLSFIVVSCRYACVLPAHGKSGSWMCAHQPACVVPLELPSRSPCMQQLRQSLWALLESFAPKIMWSFCQQATKQQVSRQTNKQADGPNPILTLADLDSALAGAGRKAGTRACTKACRPGKLVSQQALTHAAGW